MIGLLIFSWWVAGFALARSMRFDGKPLTLIESVFVAWIALPVTALFVLVCTVDVVTGRLVEGWRGGLMAAIEVWEFYKAPKELRALSGHGGDEDWVVMAPKILREDAEAVAARLAVCAYSTHTILWHGEPVLVYICVHS